MSSSWGSQERTPCVHVAVRIVHAGVTGMVLLRISFLMQWHEGPLKGASGLVILPVVEMRFVFTERVVAFLAAAATAAAALTPHAVLDALFSLLQSK